MLRIRFSAPLLRGVGGGFWLFKWSDRGAEQIPRRAIHVQDDFEIQIVKRFDVLRHERVGVERERAVAGVPAVRAVARAQINQRVARKFLLTKRASYLQRLLRPGECAVRLEITERPFRRHHGPARQPIVLRQSISRFL